MSSGPIGKHAGASLNNARTIFFFFSSRRRHTRFKCDWSSDVWLFRSDGEHFLASDANAIVAHTRQVVYLNDYDVVTVTRDRFEVQNLGADTAKVQISQLEFGAEDAERGTFKHFMLKEIFEQPRSVENALRGRVDLEAATARFGGRNMTR